MAAETLTLVPFEDAPLPFVLVAEGMQRVSRDIPKQRFAQPVDYADQAAAAITGLARLLLEHALERERLQQFHLGGAHDQKAHGRGGGYTKMDPQDARKMLIELEHQAARLGDTAAYDVIRSSYFGTSMSTTVNAVLRGQELPLTVDRAYAKEVADGVAQTAHRAAVPLPQSVVAYRGVSADANTVARLKPGGAFDDAGLTSLSFDRSQSNLFSSYFYQKGDTPVMLEVRVREGTKVIPHVPELEVALPPGSRFNVVSVSREKFGIGDAPPRINAVIEYIGEGTPRHTQELPPKPTFRVVAGEAEQRLAQRRFVWLAGDITWEEPQQFADPEPEEIWDDIEFLGTIYDISRSDDSDDEAVIRRNREIWELWMDWQEAMAEAARATTANIGGIAPVDVEDIINAQREWGSQLITGILVESRSALNEVIAQGELEGKSREEIRRMLQENFDASIMPEWRARLIAQTEVIRAANTAARNTYARLGRTEIQWLDGQPAACESCRALHGVSIRMMEGSRPGAFTDPVRGLTVYNPPLHPGCRCAVVSLELPQDIDRIEAATVPEAISASEEPLTELAAKITQILERQEFARIYVRDAKGRFSRTGSNAPSPTSLMFDEAPIEGSSAAWKRKAQKLYDTDPEFRMVADSLGYFTQGSYEDIRAGGIAAVAGKHVARVHYGADLNEVEGMRKNFMTDKDISYAAHPMATYRNYFKGQELNAWTGTGETHKRLPDKGYSIRDGGAAVQRTISRSAPIDQPLYRGDVVRRIGYRISGHQMVPDFMDKSKPPRKRLEHELHNNQKFIDEIVNLKGKTVDLLGPTSFSASRDVAETFSRGQGGGRKRRSEREEDSWNRSNVSVVWEIAPGARGIKVATLSPWKSQKEVVTSGRFKVNDVETKQSWDGRRLESITIKAEQVGTWDVD